MSDRVTITVSNGVAEVHLSRPEKLNAFDGAMFTGLVEAADQLREDSTVRAVVLTGDGRGFSAGLDTSMFGAMAGSGTAGELGAPSKLGDRLPGRITNLAQQSVYGWTELPVPVVAAVHGPVYGAGFQLALAADIRFATPDASLSAMEIRWGLLPDMTGIPMLVRLVGLDVAKELAFTGRRISGQEAADLGLVTRVSEDPLADARALAAEIAGKNPEAIRGVKALCNAAGTRPLVESFVDESQRMGRIIASPNQVEAVMAQLEGRDPVFQDD